MDFRRGRGQACPGEGCGRQTSCVGGGRGARPGGGRAHCAQAGLSRLVLPVYFLIHSISPRKGKRGLLCASLSRSLLNSCPQHPSSLSETPLMSGLETRGTKPPKQRPANPPGKGRPFSGNVNRGQLQGTLTACSSISGRTNRFQQPERLPRRGNSEQR